MYKAVIFDLDGTLIHTDQTVSDRTLNAIDKCRERGMKILLATARPERTAEMYCNMIDFDAKAFSNGARVVCGDKITEVTIPIKDKIIMNRYVLLMILCMISPVKLYLLKF
jgi:hydroxymethylpyrimidine pyrophosphatase-like HAD family hydrolase